MRIALFTETFLPKVDGIVNTLCYLLQHLAERGHESLLFAPTSPTPEYARTRIIAVGGRPFPLYPELKLASPMVNIRQHLLDFQPHLVHAVQPITLGTAGMWHARRLGIPVVASYHTDIAGYAAQWGLEWLQAPIWHTFRAIHQQADLNLCPSAETMQQLKAHDFPRLRVWTRGVDTEQFSPAWRSLAWRQRLTNGHTDAPLLLYVGRLSPEKRVEWLRPLLDHFPQVRLAIVGDGPAREKLQRLFAGTATHFTGYLRGQELAHAYAAADIFTFPSAHETLGNVVLEAMASGLPVVAAASGGPLDVVTHNHNGLLFEPDNINSLIAQVRHLLTNPHLMQRLGQQARANAMQRSWSQVLDGLLQDYQGVIQQANSAMIPAAGQTAVRPHAQQVQPPQPRQLPGGHYGAPTRLSDQYLPPPSAK